LTPAPPSPRYHSWRLRIRDGHFHGYRGDILRPDQQRERLEDEGVDFDRSGRVDLKRLRWAGPKREWVTKLRREFPRCSRSCSS
jgi:hypothetical protein